jgi:hypothetical protein
MTATQAILLLTQVVPVLTLVVVLFLLSNLIARAAWQAYVLEGLYQPTPEDTDEDIRQAEAEVTAAFGSVRS